MALMKCPDCGRDVSDQAPACPNCGRPISSPSATLSQPTALPTTSITPSAPSTPAAKKQTSYVAVGCLVLIILVTFGSIIGSLTKDSGTESSSNQASSNTKTTNLEDQQQEADRRRKQREQQLAAIREKPEEALARAKKLRKDDKFNEALALLKDIREAVPDFPDIEAEIARTVGMSEEAKKKFLVEQQKERDEARRSANLAARRLTESMLRERYLDAGLDIKVKVSGKNADRIKLTYALFSDVWSHRMSKDGSVNELCNLGFKRVEMSDGYDWGIYWTCP